MSPKITVLFYSTYGTNHAIAEEAARAAEPKPPQEPLSTDRMLGANSWTR